MIWVCTEFWYREIILSQNFEALLHGFLAFSVAFLEKSHAMLTPDRHFSLPEALMVSSWPLMV